MAYAHAGEYKAAKALVAEVATARLEALGAAHVDTKAAQEMAVFIAEDLLAAAEETGDGSVAPLVTSAGVTRPQQARAGLEGGRYRACCSTTRM